MSEQFYNPIKPEPNPLTRRKHRKEVLWQITAPLLVGVLLVVAAGIGVAYGGATSTVQVDRLASVSMIWLIIPTMVVALIFLVITAGLAYGLMRLNGILPVYTRQLQDVFVIIHTRVKRVADAVVEPIMKAHSTSARLQVLLRRK